MLQWSLCSQECPDPHTRGILPTSLLGTLLFANGACGTNSKDMLYFAESSNFARDETFTEWYFIMLMFMKY